MAANCKRCPFESSIKFLQVLFDSSVSSWLYQVKSLVLPIPHFSIELFLSLFSDFLLFNVFVVIMCNAWHTVECISFFPLSLSFSLDATIEWFRSMHKHFTGNNRARSMFRELYICSIALTDRQKTIYD